MKINWGNLRGNNRMQGSSQRHRPTRGSARQHVGDPRVDGAPRGGSSRPAEPAAEFLFNICANYKSRSTAF